MRTLNLEKSWLHSIRFDWMMWLLRRQAAVKEVVQWLDAQIAAARQESLPMTAETIGEGDDDDGARPREGDRSV